MRHPAEPGARRHPAVLGIVLLLHLALVLALWQTLRSRSVEVPAERHALLWVVSAAPPARPAPAAPSVPRREAPRRRPAPAGAPVPLPPHESNWVGPAPAIAAAPAASAASAPPVERLLDSDATRAAIRQTGRMPLLQERAAAAAGESITRTDTGLAREVAEAGQPDCLKDPVPGGILGIPLIAAQVVRGKCAK